MQLLNIHPQLRALEREWPNILAHQLPILPAMQEFWQELPNILDWLHGNGNKILKEVIPQQFSEERIDYLWQPPSMIQAWHMNVPIELIRYAGTNYLYLEIIYNNKARLIEPYNLKRTLEGNIILVAIESKGNEWKSFRIDRIQNIKVTATPFKPQYDITLTPFTQRKL